MCREPFHAKFHLLVWLGYFPNLWQYFWHHFLGLFFKWLIPQSSDQIKVLGKINLSNIFGPKCSIPSPLLESIQYSWDFSNNLSHGLRLAVHCISYLGKENGRLVLLFIILWGPLPHIRGINVYGMVRPTIEKLGAKCFLFGSFKKKKNHKFQRALKNQKTVFHLFP